MMGFVFRWLLRLFVAAALLSVLAVLGAYFVVNKSLPDYAASLVSADITGPVEIRRDRNNVPHIFSPDDRDIYFGLGLAHAQDRLWQMSVLRWTVQGRLSEQFGDRTLAIDKYMRGLSLYRLAAASVENQSPYVRVALDSYARGVNAWVDIVNRDSLGRGAPEFLLFGTRFEAWQPADSIAILSLIGVQLSTHMDEEIRLLLLTRRLPADRVPDIVPDAPPNATGALQSLSSMDPNAGGGTHAQLSVNKTVDLLSPFGLAGASNTWAAAPNRTAGQSTLLANDPHLAFSAPSIWMLARLEIATGGVIGATIPGVPLVILGRSNRIAWGLTYSYADDQDVYFEELHPEDSNQYLTNKGFRQFRTRTEVIGIKGSQSLVENYRWTENGPVLSEVNPKLASIVPDGKVASLAWTLFDPDNTSITFGFDIMRAQSLDEALEAGKSHVAPALMLMIADREQIALQLIGSLPARHPQHDTLGRLPSAGWISRNRWLGMKPYAENPRFMNPESGLLATTNNRFVDAGFPDHVSFKWGDTQRINRLKDTLARQSVHSIESFQELQLDSVSFAARTLVPLFARDLWSATDRIAQEPGGALKVAALSLLREWTGDMNEHLAEPLIYASWMQKMFELVAADELGTLIAEFESPPPVFLERVLRDTDGAGIWCDVVQSTRIETCSEIASLALSEALAELAGTYGSDLSTWRWGSAHMAAHDHPVLGNHGLLSWLVNIRQSTSGGANTINRGLTVGSGTNPYLNVSGAGYRGIYDFSDPDSSLFIIATGQSGHPLSRHYDDLSSIWRRGEYIPMSLDLDHLQAGAVGTTLIEPIRIQVESGTAEQ